MCSLLSKFNWILKWFYNYFHFSCTWVLWTESYLQNIIHTFNEADTDLFSDGVKVAFCSFKFIYQELWHSSYVPLVRRNGTDDGNINSQSLHWEIIIASVSIPFMQKWRKHKWAQRIVWSDVYWKRVKYFRIHVCHDVIRNNKENINNKIS